METIVHSNKKYFRIPEVKAAASTKESSKSKVYVIGIVDASGSMQPYWEDLTIFWNEVIPKENCTTLTFDTKVKVSETGILEPEINKHGGGGTDIPIALQKFEETLLKLPQGTPVTAIFISDGQDNRLSTLEERVKKLKGNQGYQINFICLGIQKAFPTFLSMKLREIYHTGDSAIPAVYLIEYVSQTAFFNKFETMRKYFYSSGAVFIEPPVFQYPWETDPVSELFEGTWCLTDAETLKLNGHSYSVPQTKLGIEESVDLFRGWVQFLQILSLKDVKSAQEKAQVALPKMNLMVDNLSSDLAIDIRTFFAGEIEEKLKDEALLKVSFSKRAKINFLARYGNRLMWFLKEVELLSVGSSPKFQNEFDAAKRLNLGTITGKYHQKALALKGISVEEFLKIKDEFIEIHKNTKFSSASSPQENSVITLMNQKAVFLEPDFLEGFTFVNSPYDVIETFPVVGLGAKIKRFDGSLINPWLIHVKFVATMNKSIDSVFLCKNQFCVSLEAGGEKKEELSGIIPLFTEADVEMTSLLTSRLYRFLMTYLVVQNVDTYYEEAHLALLANLLVYLLGKPENEWKSETIAQIFSTVKMCYSTSKDFTDYIEAMLNSPQESFSGETNSDVSKPIIHLVFAYKTGIYTKGQAQQTFNRISTLFFKKFLTSNDTTKLLTYEYSKEEIEAISAEMKESVLKFSSLSEFRKNVEEMIKGSALKLEKKLILNLNSLNEKELKFTLDSLSDLYFQLFGEQISESNIICLVIHAILHKDDAIMKAVNFDLQETTKNFFLADNSVVSSTNSQFKVLQTELASHYKSDFNKIHRQVLPIGKETVYQHCQKYGRDFNKLQFTESGLCTNACVSEGCHYYLDPTIDFKKHMDSWAGNLPLGFHRFVKNHFKEGVEGMLASAKKKWGKTFPQKFNETDEFVKDYLGKLIPIFENQGA